MSSSFNRLYLGLHRQAGPYCSAMTMNRGTGLFILMGMLLVAFTAVIGYYSEHLMTQINELWGAQFSGKQVMFDKHRALLPLMRETRQYPR
jgi:hypothetical protein